MAKQILNLGSGIFVINEDEGVFKILVSESAVLGGGPAKGILKVQGSAEVDLDAATALQLGEMLLNSKLPKAVEPVAEMVEGVANQAIKAIE